MKKMGGRKPGSMAGIGATVRAPKAPAVPTLRKTRVKRVGRM